MVLSPIKYQHITDAAGQIDREGIPDLNVYNDYWLLVNGKEYPFKHLTRIALQKATGHYQQIPSFQSNRAYRNYIESLGFEVKYYKEGINFFSDQDLIHFEKIGGTSYRNESIENSQEAALLSPLVYKLNKWATSSVIEDFTAQKDKAWQRSGNFNSYLWVRTYRKNDSKRCFFIVGVQSLDINQGEAYLYLMIKCLEVEAKRAGVVAPATQNKFNNHIASSDYCEKRIYRSQLKSYSWDKLIRETQDFYNVYCALYDELEDIVTEEKLPSDFKTESTIVPPPISVNSRLPVNRTFQGVLINWAKKQSHSKKLGNDGENYILNLERKKLFDLGLKDHSDLVKPMLDGEGYDIWSFNENGDPIAIEVKTTSGDIYEPFYFSINEKDYLFKKPENYFLYRLHNFRSDPPSGNYYILSGIDLIQHASFNGINFEVTF